VKDDVTAARPLAEAVDQPPPGVPDPTVEALRRELAAAKARIGELEELAHVDELTGVLNRRGFLRELRRAASYTQRYGVPVSLALFDLDAFKPINDRHGHPAGDAVLVHAAGILATNLRASDVFARIGGDEFAMLLWHADEEVIAGKAAALQAQLAASPLRWRSEEIAVSVSFGVFALDPGLAIEAVLEAVDRRLYAAKARRA
jgi:diguanylate cyclase (GGDEF)-like protein